MSNRNLKLLDWGSLLDNSSEDQYDSDETLCEEEVSDQTTVRERFQPDSDNLTSIVSRSTVNPQAELKNSYRNISFETTLPNNENNIINVHSENIKARIRESSTSTCQFPVNSRSASENLNCSDVIETSVGFLATNSEDAKKNIGDESSVYSSPPEFIFTGEKNYFSSESTFGFTEMFLNQNKKTHSKKDIPEKILPARTCSSKYVNQSKRLIESEEPPESSLRSSGTKTVKTRETKTTDSKESSTSDECAKVGRGAIKKKLPDAPGQKVSTRNKFLPDEKTVKPPSYQNLYEMEQTLILIEKKTWKWVNGEEHFLSREEAFDMLMETQRIVKSLSSLQMARRYHNHLRDCKSKLIERAQKLALAIDVAISESDQMLREECYEKLFNETSKRNGEEETGVKNCHKPILKTSNSESSGNSVSNGKHISFSDDIDFCYLSGSSQSTSGQNASQSGSSQSTSGQNASQTGSSQSTSGQNASQSGSSQSTSGQNASQSGSSQSTSGQNASLSGSSQSTSGQNASLTGSSQSTSGQNASQSQSGNEADCSQVSNEDENTTQDAVHYSNSVSHINSVRKDTSISNKTSQNELFAQVEFCELTNEENLNIESIIKDLHRRTNLQKSEVVKKAPEELSVTISKKCPSDFKHIKTGNEPATKNHKPYHHNNHKNPQKPQKLGSHDTADEGREINTASECVEKHSPTSLPSSESSSEGFGFSEEEVQTNKPNWEDISVAEILGRIKYVRVKSPAEFTNVEDEDGKWLEDLDKWD